MRPSAPGADPRPLHALADPEAFLDAVTITAADGTILAVNEGFRRLHGYTAAEVVGRNPRVLSSGLQTHELYRSMWHTITSGYAWEGELVDRTATGQLRSIRSLVTPIRDGSGRIDRFVALQRQLGPLLADQAARASGLLRIDTNGRCVLADRRAAARFDATPDELLGPGWLQRLTADDAAALHELLTMASLRGRRARLSLAGPSGWVQLVVEPAELGCGTWRGASLLLESAA